MTTCLLQCFNGCLSSIVIRNFIPYLLSFAIKDSEIPIPVIPLHFEMRSRVKTCSKFFGLHIPYIHIYCIYICIFNVFMLLLPFCVSYRLDDYIYNLYNCYVILTDCYTSILITDHQDEMIMIIIISVFFCLFVHLFFMCITVSRSLSNFCDVY